jgi:hypothetical protein
VIACAADARCDAVLTQDAWLGPVPDEVLAAGLTQPLLALRSETWATAENDARLDTLLAASAGHAQVATIAGTKHYDFTLLPLLTPLAPALGLKGPLDGARVLQITTDFLVDFFDATLKGEGTVPAAGPGTSYPEVTLEAR